MRRVVLALAVLAVVSVLAACADDDADTVDVGSGGDPEQPVSTDAGAGTTAPADAGAGGARPVEVRGGLDDPRPTAIEGATVVDEQTLLVRFYNGVEACYGVDRVQVDETAESVVIGVLTGRLPEARDMMCIEIAELQALTVTLEAPLGARTVVDASTGAPVALA